jgi:hypothetical protein
LGQPDIARTVLHKKNLYPPHEIKLQFTRTLVG